MKDACEAIGKGLSSFCVDVERMDEISMKMKAICDSIDKGTSGARAVKALRNLWQELQKLKLREMDGDRFSTLFAVVDRMHGQMIARLSPKAI